MQQTAPESSGTASRLFAYLGSRRTIAIVLVVIVSITGSFAILRYSQTQDFDIRRDAACETNVAKWTPVEFVFSGPTRSETDTTPNNPFLDYRLNVTFNGPNGSVVVPGFFDGDGNGGGSGNKWKVRFLPDAVGSWNYSAQLVKGNSVAVDLNPGAGTQQTITPDCATNFTVTDRNANAPGFFKWGRLAYTDKHYPRFVDGPYFVKVGIDSPENFLGYAGFDNTIDYGGLVPNFVHQYADHIDDWHAGDPDWNNGAGKGIIGAINFLSEHGMNSIYFLPMNLGGDGDETYPFVDGSTPAGNKNYDISKLTQWNTTLRHAQEKDIMLHIVLAEEDDANLGWLGGAQTLTNDRKLYLRELIARFGYLPAIQWNITEEWKIDDFPIQTVKDVAEYIHALDWQDHQVTYHMSKDRITDYDWAYGYPYLDASSIEYTNTLGIFEQNWAEVIRRNTFNAGRPWAANLDENYGGLEHNAGHYRLSRLYDILFSGGGLEWYFGCANYCIDVTADSFETGDLSELWGYSKVAREFVMYKLPFWDMKPQDELVLGEPEDEPYGGAEVFALPGQIYAIYFPLSPNFGDMDFRGVTGQFVRQWYSPVTGNPNGSPTTVSVNNEIISNGSPPSGNGDHILVYTNVNYNYPGNPPGGAPPPPQNKYSCDSNTGNCVLDPNGSTLAQCQANCSPPPTGLTRAQVGQMIFDDFGDPNFNPPGSPTFGDVPNSHPNYQAIEWMAANNITSGCGNGNFCPGQTATKAMTTVFLYNAGDLDQYPDPSTTPYFSDVTPESHPWAFEQVQQFKELGITTGCGGGKFCPSDATDDFIYTTFRDRIQNLEPPPVTGTVNVDLKFKLQGVFDQKPNKVFPIELVGDAHSHSQTPSCTSDSNGVYTCTLTGVIPGSYTVYARGPLHLRKNFGLKSVTANTGTIDLSDFRLLAGDIVVTGSSENKINALDISKVIIDYFPDSPPNSAADLNFDGTVNAIDIGYVIQNYGRTGD